MKDIVLIMNEDNNYSKKFCNQANKILGKKYVFLTFSTIKAMNEYIAENKILAAIISDMFYERVEDIDVNHIYILNEKDKIIRKEGKKTYLYKLQNINNILKTLDSDIESYNANKRISQNADTKLVLFYSPSFIKNKSEIIKRISKYVLKKKTSIIVNLDEFENYKGKVGLSNLIFEYKENTLDIEKLRKEIVTEKDQDYIKSITYPEDYNVISNIDLANIINEISKLPYDYIFVNADTSFVRCQYILNDSDILVIFKDKNNERNDSFKQYLKSENAFDFKKVSELDLTKLDKTYLLAFSKQLVGGKNDK